MPRIEFETSYPELLNLIISQLKLDVDMVHGISHWRRVREIGNYLAKHTKADIEIVNLFACEHHSNPNIKSNDITIQTCWDADRLDLWRIGITPNKLFLNTDFAKQNKVIKL